MMFTNRKAAEMLGRDRKVQNDDKATGHLGFEPTFAEHFRWDLDRLAALLFYMDQRAAGFTVKLAGQAATRLHSGISAHPDADQLTILTLENGNKSILPADTIDLASGFISGGYLASALLVDVRNLKMRVQRAIDTDAAVIGDRDD